ncbi:MAG: hypothetical protein ABIM21_01080 [candidate division WOR-3 bacterium]
MSSTIAQKLELAQIRADRAQESLKEAEVNSKGRMFRTSIICESAFAAFLYVNA